MKRFSVHRLLAAVALVLTAVPAVARAQSINLTGNESPTFGFGKGGLSTFGQTFTAPTGSTALQTFSFWLSNDSMLGAVNPASLLFQGYVMQWDSGTGRATGPVLYTSGVRTGPTALSQQYSFATGGVAVTQNQQYVAFLSASSQLAAIAANQSLVSMETSLNGTYAGGAFVFADNGSNLGSLSTEQWLFTGSQDYQSRFSATFTSAVSVVPEPSTFALCAAGCAVLVVAGARRRRA